MKNIQTLRGYSFADHIFGTFTGLIVLVVLSGIGLLAYYICSLLSGKCLIILLGVAPCAICVAWHIGYTIERRVIGAGGWSCLCGYLCNYPLTEWYHKRKCLSWQLNGKSNN